MVDGYYICLMMVYNNLVDGWPNPEKMMEFVSWDANIPNIWKHIIYIIQVPNHQPDHHFEKDEKTDSEIRATGANIQVLFSKTPVFQINLLGARHARHLSAAKWGIKDQCEWILIQKRRRELWYTVWFFNIAMENGPFRDGLPIKNGDFPWLC